MSLNKMIADAHAAHKSDMDQSIDHVLSALKKCSPQTVATYTKKLVRDGIKRRIEGLRSSDKSFVKKTGTTTAVVNRSTGPGSQWTKKVPVTTQRARSRSVAAVAAVEETLFDTWMYHRAGKCLGDMTIPDWQIEITADAESRDGLNKNEEFNTSMMNGCTGRRMTRKCWSLDAVEAERDRVFGQEG